MAIIIQYRRGLASSWASVNPVLASGEPGYETDTGKFKVGDGTIHWNNLTYSSGIKGDKGDTGEITTGTDTNITGILKGAASKVAQAVAGTDYSTPGHSHSESDITNLTTDLAAKTTLSAVKADTDIADAITKKHSNTLDHDGSAQDTTIAGKTTLTAVKADTDIADAISKKHSNTLDHSNTNDPSADQKAALAGTSGTPGSGNKFVTDGDARNSNARTPTTHSHPESDINNLTTDLAAKETPAGSQAKVDTHAALIAAHGMGAQCLTSNFTTSSVTAVSTNLTFTIGANEIFAVDVYGTCSKASSATGLKFAIGAPTGCVVKGFQLGGGATLAAALVPSLISAINTLGTALATGTGIEVAFALHFRVVNGSTPGNITIQVATVTSNTATVYAGTKMIYNKASQV